MKNWLIKLWKDGVRWRFLHWVIPRILPHYHLAHNPKGVGRKKSIPPEVKAAKEFYDREEKKHEEV